MAVFVGVAVMVLSFTFVNGSELSHFGDFTFFALIVTDFPLQIVSVSGMINSFLQSTSLTALFALEPTV